MLLKIVKCNKVIELKKVPLSFKRRNISSVFCEKNNLSLSETLEKPKYSSLRSILSDVTDEQLKTPLGDYLRGLKEVEDKRYLQFLNKHGDSLFCEFVINDCLSDRGIYCWVHDNEIKYVGRCFDSFKKRINQGCGKIAPAGCFKDGQSTNCHVNSQINKIEGIELYIHRMPSSLKYVITELKRDILLENDFEWNIQKK